MRLWAQSFIMIESHEAFLFMLENNEEVSKNSTIIQSDLSQQSNFDYWKPVLYFYAKTTSWIILPLLLGALAGGYVSRTVGSQVLFFVFIMFGFLITCLGIYREVKQYKKSLDISVLKDLKKEEK